MPSFITESWLRQEFSLAHGTEIHLPAGSRLTPSASQLLSERRIRIKFIDEEGRVYLAQGTDETDKPEAPVHPLTGTNQQPGNSCVLCNSHVAKKTELLTLLDNDHLVPKTHPRIGLRGKLDTLIAQTVLVQTQFDTDKKYPLLHMLLADLRSFMGQVLRCEVTGEELAGLSMGAMTQESIHAVSHQPLKYLGHDHLVPEQHHGLNVALLNLIRALVREAELDACRVFVTDSFTLSRKDIVQGLNRLSSAFYVLMIMTVVSESGAIDAVAKVAGQ